jgi:hypothetical protein
MSGWRTGGQPDHPIRVAIVEAIEWIGEPCSAVQLVPCLGEHPATVNYHMNVLVNQGVLVLASTHRRRNAEERRYRIA